MLYLHLLLVHFAAGTWTTTPAKKETIYICGFNVKFTWHSTIVGVSWHHSIFSGFSNCVCAWCSAQALRTRFTNQFDAWKTMTSDGRLKAPIHSARLHPETLVFDCETRGLDMHFDALRCFYTSQTDQASQETHKCYRVRYLHAANRYIGLRVLQNQRRVSFSMVSSSQQRCSEGWGMSCVDYWGYDSVWF